MGSFSVSND
jgi:hypothetical protein